MKTEVKHTPVPCQIVVKHASDDVLFVRDLEADQVEFLNHDRPTTVKVQVPGKPAGASIDQEV